MWAPCPYIRPFSQLPHIHSGAFELCFSHHSHLRDPDSLTFTMVLSDSHFSLEPRDPFLAPRAQVRIPCPHFIITATVIYVLFSRYVSRQVFGLNVQVLTHGPLHAISHGSLGSSRYIFQTGIQFNPLAHSFILQSYPLTFILRIPTPGSVVPSPPLHSGTIIW
jgi:hypothetical protein